MKITARQLRQVIREELQRNLLREEESPFVAGTLAPLALGRYIKGEEGRMSEVNLQKLVDFFSGVLAGEIVVDAGRNDFDQNLMISLVIAAYVKSYAPELADDPVFVGHVSTTYADDLIRKLQRKLNLQVDGDFGRQTLVALVTNGKYILDPTARATLSKSESRRKMLAFKIGSAAKTGELKMTPEEIKTIIFGPGGMFIPPKMPGTYDLDTAPDDVLPGLKRGAPREGDVTVPMSPISPPPPGTISTGGNLPIDIERGPFYESARSRRTRR